MNSGFKPNEVKNEVALIFLDLSILTTSVSCGLRLASILVSVSNSNQVPREGIMSAE